VRPGVEIGKGPFEHDPGQRRAVPYERAQGRDRLPAGRAGHHRRNGPARQPVRRLLHPGWSRRVDHARAAATALQGAGGQMLQAVIFHSDNLELSEQFDATTGYEKSVSNLSWSYASSLSAVRARNAI
jgi:hypothetical protein